MARNHAFIPVVEDVARPQAWGYDGRIDNILIRLSIDEQMTLEVVTAEANPPKVDTAISSEDIRDETGFRYSRVDLSGGAGVDFLHVPDRPTNATTRFWDSRGIDVFSSDKGKVYDAGLHHEILLDTAIGTGTLMLDEIDGILYYVNDDELWEYAASPAKVTLAANAKAFFAMGNSLYTADPTAGVRRFDPPSYTGPVIDTSDYDNIWGAKARAFGAIDNILYETHVTTPVVVLTLPPADRITDVIDAGTAILVFNTTGTIYLLGLDDSLAVVNLGQSTFHENEIPVLGAYAQGVIGVVTTSDTDAGGKVARFYTADIAADGTTLGPLQLIYQVGDRETTEDLTPDVVFSTRDSIYVVTKEEGESVSTFWRYYLPTGGYSRSFETSDTNPVDSVVEIDDRLWAALPTDGIWKEQNTYIESGYLIGPAADFFTADAKQWISGRLSITTNPAGATVDLYDSTDPVALSDKDHSSWALAAKVVTTGEDEVEVNDLTGRLGRFHLAKVELMSPADRATTPALRSYAFRAFPSSDRDTLVRLPVNVSDQFESPGKRAMVRRGRGIIIEQTLRAFEGKQVTLELYGLRMLLRGMLERIELPVAYAPERGTPLRVMYLTIRGEEIAGSSSGFGGTSSGASLGQNRLGIPKLGVGIVS